MKFFIPFLTISMIFLSCASNNNVGKTFYENRSSKEIMVDRLVDASLSNTKDYAVKEVEQKKNSTFQNQDRDKEEMKQVLHLNSEQVKKVDQIYLVFNDKKEEIMNSLSFDDYQKSQKIEILNKKRDDELLKILDDFQTQIFLGLEKKK